MLRLPWLTSGPIRLWSWTPRATPRLTLTGLFWTRYEYWLLIIWLIDLCSQIFLCANSDRLGSLVAMSLLRITWLEWFLTVLLPIFAVWFPLATLPDLHFQAQQAAFYCKNPYYATYTDTVSKYLMNMVVHLAANVQQMLPSGAGRTEMMLKAGCWTAFSLWPETRKN